MNLNDRCRRFLEVGSPGQSNADHRPDCEDCPADWACQKCDKRGRACVGGEW
jgi:hypothetical protein